MAMVPAAAAAAPYAPYLAMGDFVMAHRSELAQGARSFASAASKRAKQWAKRSADRKKGRGRGRTQAKRNRIADPIGSHTVKRAQVAQTSEESINTRSLYQRKLIDVDFGDNINQRQRNIINVSGIKISMEMKNITANPMYVNFAVISPKAGVDPSANLDTLDFFRASDSNDRSKDFSEALTSTEFHMLPINTDKYTVLKTKRSKVVAALSGGDTVALSGSSYLNLDWWIPLKRQFRFDGTLSTPDNGQVYLVYWFDMFMQPGGTLKILNGAKVSEKTILYYHEPRNGCCR